MTLKTLIIDDEPIALEKLRSYVEKVPFLTLAGECSSGLEAMRVLSTTPVDLIFTDIQMPDLNGMEMVQALHTAPMIVFTTAYAQYAVESYRVSAIDYLLKPYSFVDFQRAANKALENYSARHQDIPTDIPPIPGNAERTNSNEDSLFVKVDYRFVRIALKSIRYIKGYGEYLQIYLEGETQPMLTLSSFNAIMDCLSENFLQVHRSYIVNMNHVDHIIRQRIVMDKDTYVPVGDSYRNSLMQYLMNHAPASQVKKQS